MKFAKLFLLVAFSFLSVGLNALMVRAAEGTGYGYGCQAPYSSLDGSIGCGDEIPPDTSSDCTFTDSGASVCGGEPEIIYDSQSTPADSNYSEPTQSTPNFGFWEHVGQAGQDATEGALEGGANAFVVGGPEAVLPGAAGGAVGGVVRGCVSCHLK